MQLYVDAHSPIPIRRQLAEQLKHFIESGGFPREQALPSIREMAGFHILSRRTEKGLYVGYSRPRALCSKAWNPSSRGAVVTS